MADNQQTDPSTVLDALSSPQARRGRRRGGRGRGRRRGTEPKTTVPGEQVAHATAQAPVGGLPVETAVVGEKPAPSLPTAAVKNNTGSPTASRRGAQGPNRRQALQAAKRHVREIIESLQHTVEEMEQVQRLLDQAERERNEDLHDLESLRQALTRLQSPRHESRSRPSRKAG